MGVTYDAFGNITSTKTTTPFGYRGEYKDSETGYIYLRNRYYDPDKGRFISEDPICDGLNWYAYCGNNPIKYIDPWGLFDYDTRLSTSNKYSKDVEALQYELSQRGFYGGKIDGIFGQQTLNAVNSYKSRMNLGNTGNDWGVVGLQTWSSLGLIYRTKEDIGRGLEIKLVDHVQYFDVTKMFNDQLWYAEQYLNDLPWYEVTSAWYNKVNIEGDWDIKVRESWDRTFGGSYPGAYNTKVILYGEFSSPEKMGNIMYAYTGKVVGWSDAALYAGSFWAADTGSIAGVKNELSDWSTIAYGINLYNQKHPYSWIPMIL